MQEDIFTGRAVRTATTIRVADAQIADMAMGMSTQEADTRGMYTGQVVDTRGMYTGQVADTRGMYTGQVVVILSMCTGQAVGILSMGKLPTGSRGIYMMRDARTAKLEAESPSTY